MKFFRISVSAALLGFLPTIAFAQVPSTTQLKDDNSNPTDSTATMMITDAQAQQRVLNTFTQVSSYVDVDNPATFLDNVFDVRAYVSHACFSIESDAEAGHCKILFGSYYDLGATLHNGILSDILLNNPRIHNSAMIMQSLDLAMEEMEANAQVDNGTTIETDTEVRNSRSMQIWDECKALTNIWEMRRSCFQENQGLVNRSDVSLEDDGNFSDAWMNGSDLFNDNLHETQAAND